MWRFGGVKRRVPVSVAVLNLVDVVVVVVRRRDMVACICSPLGCSSVLIDRIQQVGDTNIAGCVFKLWCAGLQGRHFAILSQLATAAHKSVITTVGM